MISVERDGGFVEIIVPRSRGSIIFRVTLNEAIDLYDALRTMLYPPPTNDEEPDA